MASRSQSQFCAVAAGAAVSKSDPLASSNLRRTNKYPSMNGVDPKFRRNSKCTCDAFAVAVRSLTFASTDAKIGSEKAYVSTARLVPTKN